MSYLYAEKPSINLTWMVKEFKRLHDEGKIDLSPWYQRNFVANRHWARCLMAALMKRSGINTIHLRAMPDGSYEVLDGLQRLTVIFKFYGCEIDIEGEPGSDTVYIPQKSESGMPFDAKIKRKYSKMNTKQKNYFHEREIPVTIYDESMTDDEAAQKFIDLNNGNDVKSQEKRNAIKGFLTRANRGTYNPLGDDVEKGFERHTLFNKVILTNDRRQAEEWIAKITAYQIAQEDEGNYNFHSVVNQNILDDMYTADSPDHRQFNYDLCIKTYNKICKKLDIIEKIYDKVPSKIRKRVFGTGAKILFHYQFLLELDIRNLKITNFKTFSEHYANTFFLMLEDKKTLYDGKQESRDRVTFTTLMGLYLQAQMTAKMDVFFNELSKDNNDSIKTYVPGTKWADSTRCFNLADIHKKFVENGSICGVEQMLYDEGIAKKPKKISIDIIEGGHIISYFNEGETIFKNLMPMKFFHNRAMRDMNVDEYVAKLKKEYNDNRLEEAA